MNRASSSPPTLPGLAFWVMVFGVCGGLYQGSPLLLWCGLLVPPVLLVLWALRRV